MKTHLGGRTITDAKAIAAGFPWACRSPRGHSVSWHRTEQAARDYLVRYLRKTGCIIVALVAFSGATKAQVCEPGWTEVMVVHGEASCGAACSSFSGKPVTMCARELKPPRALVLCPAGKICILDAEPK